MKAYTVINIMNGLFEQLIRYKDNFSTNEGIAFCCEVRSECHGYEHDGMTHHEEWRGFCLMYFYAMFINPQSVFIQERKEKCSSVPKTGWVNSSNHDSCWREGTQDLTYLGFNCWDMAHRNCPKEFRPKTRDEGLDFSLRWGILGPVFKTVRVEKTLMEDGYHWRITNVKEIKNSLINLNDE